MQERFLTSVKEILRERLAMEQEEDSQDPERLPGDMLSVALTPARLREADKSLPPRFAMTYRMKCAVFIYIYINLSIYLFIYKFIF